MKLIRNKEQLKEGDRVVSLRNYFPNGKQNAPYYIRGNVYEVCLLMNNSCRITNEIGRYSILSYSSILGEEPTDKEKARNLGFWFYLEKKKIMIFRRENGN